MKRNLIILTAFVLTLVLCLSACTPEKKVSAITVVEGTLNAEYEVGDTTDFSGLKAVISYSDGTAETVTADKLGLSVVDTSTAGTKKLTITYKDFSIDVDITVSEKPAVTLTGIEVVPGSIATELFIGDALDTSGIQATASYSDGTTKALTAADLTLSEIDTSTVGDKTLTVTYEGVSTEVTIKVAGITSMQIVSGSLPSEVFVGETLDTSKFEALVSYEGGKSEVVKTAKVTFGELDTATMGDKTLTITYRGFTLEFAVKVVGVTEITVNVGSVATSVKVGSALDTSAITATASYNNGTQKALATSDLTVGALDTSIAGTKALTVSYMGVETTVSITVVGVKSITVISGTLKSEILVGEALDTALLQVNVVYTDNTNETLSAAALELGTVNSATSGDKQLAITYLDKTENVTVKVCGIESLRVDGIPKSIAAGEELDLTNMKVYAVYSDSNKTEVLLDGASIITNKDDLNFDVEGDKQLIVLYNGTLGEYNTAVTISTTPPELIGLEILVYNKVVALGAVYDKTNIKATALYGNDTSDVITGDKLTISDVATDVAGNVTLTVSYTEDGLTANATATVKVLPITSLQVSGLASKVDFGGTYSTDGVSLVVTFSDGTDTITKTVTKADGVTVSELNTKQAGDQTLTVSYLGSSTEFVVHVKAVSKIEILAGSVDAYVRYGYDIDTSRLEVKITYTDGTDITKKASELGDTLTTAYGSTLVKPGDNQKKVSVTLTVSYVENTVSVSTTAAVEVLQISSVNAINGTVPTSVLQNSAYTTDNVKLTVIYTDSTGKEYVYLVGKDDPRLSVGTIDTAKPGDKALIFEYMPTGDGKFEFKAVMTITVKGVSGLSVVDGTLQTKLNVGQDLDVTGIIIKVQFTDGTFTYIDTSYIGNGLSMSEPDTSTSGPKTLTITYLGTTLDVVIDVFEVNVSKNTIFGIELPDSIVARNTYMQNFKDQTAMYVVGNMNPYRFYLNVLMLDENDELVDADGKTLTTTVKIYLIDGGNETLLEGDALTAMVVPGTEKNTYQFTDAAKNKTFMFRAQPAENYVGDAWVEHTFKVVEAYNIYDAKELNLLTNAHVDLNGGKMEGYLYQDVIVNEYLREHSIARPERLPGIVLHSNVNVTVKDIPEKYFYTYTDKNGVEQKEFYDKMSVYYMLLDDSNKDFTFYGNYYTVYTYSLPCIVPNGVANNDDQFSSTSVFRYALSYEMRNSISKAKALDFSQYHANIENVAFRDNDPNSNDQAASERHIRGTQCMRFSLLEANVYNTNIDAYYISMMAEDDNLTVNIDKCKFYNAWQNHMFVWNCNYLNEYNNDYNSAPYANYSNIKVNITDSLLAKCGGPVIISQSKNRAYKCNELSGGDIVVDAKTEIYSYTTGQEAWYVAVNQTPLAGQILAMSQLVQKSAYEQHGLSASYATNEEIQGYPAYNMIYINMGTGLNIGGNETYRGSFTRLNEDGTTTTGLDMTNNTVINTMTTTFKQYIAAGAIKEMPPMLQSSTGAACFTDGETGCYGGINPSTGKYVNANAACFDGDYITLYYMGMGIMLEYFN